MEILIPMPLRGVINAMGKERALRVICVMPVMDMDICTYNEGEITAGSVIGYSLEERRK
ncbi:MAG: hypothetical protein ABID64_01930 [Nitrospirota bacterium]